MLLLNTVNADNPSAVDYVDVKSGETVPFNGKLFTNEAIAKILANRCR